MSDFSKGDHVRVVIEGKVTRTYPGTDRGFVIDDHLLPHGFVGDHVKSVEVIKPPAVTFGPGDTVRYKGGRSLRVLSHDGYVAVPSGVFYRYGMDGYDRSEFTSKRYEKVDLNV